MKPKLNKYVKPILDIAVLTAGRVDLFSKCIDAILLQHKPEFRIHVCNNGHPSPEYEEVYKKLPFDAVIKRVNEDNGFGAGANNAINSGSAPLVLFITDDVFIHEGAIMQLLETMQDESIGLCGLKLLFPEDSTETSRPAGRVQHIGMAVDIRGNMTHPLIGWKKENPKCNISREVLAVTGASFMVRRNAFNQVRGFDPIYGKGYYEDMDLCMKIRSLSNGGQRSRIYIDTKAVGTHGVAQTFKNEKTPPPMQQNTSIFRTRWFQFLQWTEYEFF
jgi:GT2 family glycosyltransferase